MINSNKFHYIQIVKYKQFVPHAKFHIHPNNGFLGLFFEFCGLCLFFICKGQRQQCSYHPTIYVYIKTSYFSFSEMEFQTSSISQTLLVVM